jgi:hypothetical protein
MKCGTCGRETLPDGDCYGCECDRLRATSRRVAQILIDAVGSDGTMNVEVVALWRAVARTAELEAENERLQECNTTVQASWHRQVRRVEAQRDEALAEVERLRAASARVNQLRSVLQSLEPWTGLPVAAVLTVLREKVK